ncbi:unannotated protein [freshwater metagenome]|uniref:Unannotated protein n=1 Tax=freshwater metagenome TaxID=449393 RepID=A0A6J7ERI6_9ZZZZ|nr:hypothetical protein [Actinomycetota bacterium]
MKNLLPAKVLITALAVALISQSLISTATASTSKGWRYWGYYQAAANSSTWKAAMTGPTVDIADGSVEGWVFTFSNDDIPSTPPSVKPSFKTICGKTKAQAGTKRIGLVVDFGDQSYSPKGEKAKKTIIKCVVTAKESQGIDVLAQEIKLRTADSGLICGLNGYPAKECGVEIQTPINLAKK